MRTWKVKVKDAEGKKWTHYIHDDGKWEMAPGFPATDYTELSAFITRLNLAAAQFGRLGWTSGELERE